MTAPKERRADWTLVKLKAHHWVAMNQEGEVFSYGKCARDNVAYWCKYGPPKGAAYGEHGRGWRGNGGISELGTSDAPADTEASE
jgi:hypothetical protein